MRDTTEDYKDMRHQEDFESMGKGQDEDAEVSIFDSAIMGDMNAVLGYLKTGTVNDRDKWGESMLHKAALNDQICLAKELIERGADVNLANACQKTPLQYSCLGGSKFVALLLVEHGADVHAMDSCRQTAMHSACIYGHLDTAQILRAHGADVSVVDEHNMTPLHYSSANGHADVVRFLVAAGARLEAKDNEGRTPLHTACIWGELEVIQFLVVSGADTDSTDLAGRKPLQELDVHSLKDLKVMEENALRASAYNNNCYEADEFQSSGLSTSADGGQPSSEHQLSAQTVQLAAIETGLEKAQLFNNRLQQQQQIQGCVLQREMLERQRNEKALTATFMRVQRLENILKRSAAFMYEDVVGQQERAIQQLQEAAKAANARLVTEQKKMMSKMEDEQKVQSEMLSKLQTDAVDAAVSTKLNAEQLAVMSKLLSDKDVILAAQKRALEELVTEQERAKAKSEQDVDLAEKRMEERDALIAKQQQDIQRLIDDADLVRRMAQEAAHKAEQKAVDYTARQQKESEDRCKEAEDKAALHQERYEKLQGLVQQLLDDAQNNRLQQQGGNGSGSSAHGGGGGGGGDAAMGGGGGAASGAGGGGMEEMRQQAAEAARAARDAQQLAAAHKKKLEQQEADIKRLQEAVLEAQQSKEAMAKAAKEANDRTAFQTKRYEEQQADIKRLQDAVQATQVKNVEDYDNAAVAAKNSLDLAEAQKAQILQQQIQFNKRLADVEEARMKSLAVAEERAQQRYNEEQRNAKAQQDCINDQRKMLDMLLAEREEWKKQSPQEQQQHHRQQQQQQQQQQQRQLSPQRNQPPRHPSPQPQPKRSPSPLSSSSASAAPSSSAAAAASSAPPPLPMDRPTTSGSSSSRKEKEDMALLRRLAVERVFDEEKARVEQLTREDAERVVQACADGLQVNKDMVMQVLDRRNTVLAAVGVASSSQNEQREVHETLVSHFSTRYLCSVLTAAAEAATDEAVRQSLLALAEQQSALSSQSERGSRFGSNASVGSSGSAGSRDELARSDVGFMVDDDGGGGTGGTAAGGTAGKRKNISSSGGDSVGEGGAGLNLKRAREDQNG